MSTTENNKCILISSVNGNCYCTDGEMSYDRAYAKIFQSREDAEVFIKDNEFYALDIVQLTYDVHFNDDEESNDVGLSETLDYCRDYIKNGSASKSGYFADYPTGYATIVCDQTEEIVEYYSCNTGELFVEVI